MIAAVNGACVAGGLEIMLGTDLRIASQTATFGLAEVRGGGGTSLRGATSACRARSRGPSRCRCCSPASRSTPRRAYEVGLVNEVVPAGDVLARARVLAKSIAKCGPVAVRTAKEIAVRAMALEPGFALEHALAERVFRSDDAREDHSRSPRNAAPISPAAERRMTVTTHQSATYSISNSPSWVPARHPMSSLQSPTPAEWACSSSLR